MKRIIIFGLLCLFIISITGCTKPVEIIAHRGASGYLPEHTLPAKALAHAMGLEQLPSSIETLQARFILPAITGNIDIPGGEGLRMQLAEAKAAHAKRDTEERQGKTPQGRQFLQKAKEDMQRGDHASACSNLQMALTFESDNAYFKELLEEARGKRGK